MGRLGHMQDGRIDNKVLTLSLKRLKLEMPNGKGKVITVACQSNRVPL